MLTKTEAIVLHSFKYGEQKIIVDMFTRLYGRMAFVAAIPKNAKGRLKKQYFQPLTLLDITCEIRPHVQLQKLSEASLHAPLLSLLSEPAKLAIGLFIAEFLYHALKNEQQNEPLFDYILSALSWLDGKEDHYANFHLVFLMHLSRFLGFRPYLDGYHEGDFFDLLAGTFSATPPQHRNYLIPQEAAIMRLMMRMDLTNMHLFRMNHQQRNRCVEVAMQYYHLHLPDFPELHSLEVLRELWTLPM